MELRLHYGALADPLIDQLYKQGLRFKQADYSKRYQAYSDAIVKLHLGGVLTDGEVDKARQRLHKLITQNVEAIK